MCVKSYQLKLKLNFSLTIPQEYLLDNYLYEYLWIFTHLKMCIICLGSGVDDQPDGPNKHYLIVPISSIS